MIRQRFAAVPRGSLTKSVTPGHTLNAQYDTTGTAVEQDDGYGHSVNVTTSSATNFILPSQIAPNNSSQLATNALYNTPTLAPTSVAPPNQTVFDPSTNS